MKSLLDFIPIIVFFILYKTVDKTDANHPLMQIFGLSGGTNNNHILVATLGLVIATVIIYGGFFISQKFRLDKQQWFVLAMTVVFGGLTLALSDDYYIRLKAILLNFGFALGFLLSPLVTKDKAPLVRKMFASALVLSDDGWKKLNWAWVGLFVLLALLHLFFGFVFMNGDYWGEFTAFGDMAVMMTFIIGMMAVLNKHFKTSA